MTTIRESLEEVIKEIEEVITPDNDETVEDLGYRMMAITGMMAVATSAVMHDHPLVVLKAVAGLVNHVWNESIREIARDN